MTNGWNWIIPKMTTTPNLTPTTSIISHVEYLAKSNIVAIVQYTMGRSNNGNTMVDESRIIFVDATTGEFLSPTFHNFATVENNDGMHPASPPSPPITGVESIGGKVQSMSILEHSVRSHTPWPIRNGKHNVLDSSSSSSSQRRHVTVYMSIYIVTSHGEMLCLSNVTNVNDSTPIPPPWSIRVDPDYDTTTTATGTYNNNKNTIPVLSQWILPSTSSSSVFHHPTHGANPPKPQSRHTVTFFDIDDWMDTLDSDTRHVVTPPLPSSHHHHNPHPTTVSMESILSSQQQLPILRGTFVRKYMGRNFS